MGLGFSYGANPSQPVQPSPLIASEALMGAPQKPQSIAKDFELLARTAAVVALQMGSSSFFRDINANRYVSRMAIFSPNRRDDDTFDKKRARNIIRKLKVESSEAMNHYFR